MNNTMMSSRRFLQVSGTLAAGALVAPTAARAFMSKLLFGGEGSLSDHQAKSIYTSVARLFDDISNGTHKFKAVFPELNDILSKFSGGEQVQLNTGATHIGVYVLAVNSKGEKLFLENYSVSSASHEGEWKVHKNPEMKPGIPEFFNIRPEEVIIEPAASSKHNSLIKVVTRLGGGQSYSVPMDKNAWISGDLVPKAKIVTKL